MNQPKSNIQDFLFLYTEYISEKMPENVFAYCLACFTGDNDGASGSFALVMFILD